MYWHYRKNGNCSILSSEVNNSFISPIQFSRLVGHFVAWQGSNIISCFLISFTHQVEFFLLIFFKIFWSFSYSTVHKRCLETWSCVCGYCAYGLFLCFRSLRNIPKNARELGVGHGQFHSGVNGLRRQLSSSLTMVAQICRAAMMHLIIFPHNTNIDSCQEYCKIMIQ